MSFDFVTCSLSNFSNKLRVVFSPCSTSDIENVFYTVVIQKIAEEFSIWLCSFLVSTDVVLPDFCGFSICVLIWNARDTDSQGTCTVNAINHGDLRVLRDRKVWDFYSKTTLTRDSKYAVKQHDWKDLFWFPNMVCSLFRIRLLWSLLPNMVEEWGCVPC